MSDFVGKYGRIAAIFGAGAFLLSLVIGLVSRNPFGVALLRALLMAVVFAGLGGGIRFVISTYLPELAGSEGSSDATTATTDGRGQKVDIVLPEEGPPSRRTGGGSSLEDSPLGVFGQGDEDLGAEPMPSAEAGVMDSLAEELEEELPAATEAGLDGQGAGLADDDLAGQGSVDAPGAAERGTQGSKGGSRRSRRGGDTDEESLPDISNLEIVTDRGTGAPGVQPAGPSEQSPEDAMKGAVGGQDPALLARAIRTVLKRDEKG